MDWIYMVPECVPRRRDNHVRIVLVAHQKKLKVTAVPTNTIQLGSGAGLTQGTHFPGFTLDPGADPGPAVEPGEIKLPDGVVAAVPGKPIEDVSDLEVVNGRP
jgi:hypothetical protein